MQERQHYLSNHGITQEKKYPTDGQTTTKELSKYMVSLIVMSNSVSSPEIVLSGRQVESEE